MRRNGVRARTGYYILLIFLVLALVLFSALYQFDDAIVGQFRTAPSQSVQQAVSQETLTETNEKIIYVYGAGLIARKDSAGLVYQHQDYLSSNRFATDGSGKLVSREVQEPYGVSFEDVGTAAALSNDYSFTGKEEDDRLYYFGSRYYDPRTARFISVDPVASAGSSYAYAGNNPVGFVDPDGRARWATNWHPTTWEEVKDAFREASAWQRTPLGGLMIVQAFGTFMSYLDPYGLTGFVGAGVIGEGTALRTIYINKANQVVGPGEGRAVQVTDDVYAALQSSFESVADIHVRERVTGSSSVPLDALTPGERDFLGTKGITWDDFMPTQSEHTGIQSIRRNNIAGADIDWEGLNALIDEAASIPDPTLDITPQVLGKRGPNYITMRQAEVLKTGLAAMREGFIGTGRTTIHTAEVGRRLGINSAAVGISLYGTQGKLGGIPQFNKFLIAKGIRPG